jgi:phosphoribosyl 1,2-cyclic phosphodiesterase
MFSLSVGDIVRLKDVSHDIAGKPIKPVYGIITSGSMMLGTDSRYYRVDWMGSRSYVTLENIVEEDSVVRVS